jgi:AraC-like DNA-binding protein
MNFAEVARQFGLNPARLVRQMGLDPRVLTLTDLRIPAAKVVALLEAAALESECETFGLRMAESRRLSDFGALSLLITHQPTLREVLTTLGQYRHLVNETLIIQVEETASAVVVREDLLLTSPTGARQAYELAVGVLVRIFRALLGARWRPLSVEFTHGAPRDLSVHHRLFGHEVIFDSDFNGVVCSLADLDRANPSADPVMAGYARNFVDTLPRAGQRSILGEVQKAIHLLLPTGQATLERVAESIGVPQRTLQRRMADQGADFRQVLDEVRCDLALRFVANEAFTLTRVSQLLGYSQSSTFTRWFHGRFGLAPSDWRRREAAGGAGVAAPVRPGGVG